MNAVHHVGGTDGIQKVKGGGVTNGSVLNKANRFERETKLAVAICKAKD